MLRIELRTGGWKPLIFPLNYTRRCVGGWVPVYQQETGITTVVNFTSLPKTRLVSRFSFRSSTTCVSSPYPAFARKIIQSLPMLSSQQIQYNSTVYPCQPPILFHLLGLTRQKFPASFLVVINISYDMEYLLVFP